MGFRSNEFVGSESSGHLEVVVIISRGSSTSNIDVMVNPRQIRKSEARGEG